MATVRNAPSSAASRLAYSQEAVGGIEDRQGRSPRGLTVHLTEAGKLAELLVAPSADGNHHHWLAEGLRALNPLDAHDLLFGLGNLSHRRRGGLGDARQLVGRTQRPFGRAHDQFVARAPQHHSGVKAAGREALELGGDEPDGAGRLLRQGSFS